MTDITPAARVDRSSDHDLVAGMFRVVTAVDGFTAQLRRTFSLNAHERLAVSALWSEGPMTMTQLSAWIPLSRAAVTTLVDRLETAGLVRRTSDPSDRRRTVVEVSQAALDRSIPVLEPWAADLRSLADRFDDEQWAVIDEFLDGLRSLSERHADQLKRMSDGEIQALATPRTDLGGVGSSTAAPSDSSSAEA